MKKRPVSITVIAWILLVINALSLLGSLLTFNNPVTREQMAQSSVPVPLQYAVSFLMLAVSILCAIFMLRGANWARVLYLVAGAIGLLFGFLTAPSIVWVIPGVVIYALIVFFLLRPKATAYFTQAGDPPNA
jgi:NAD/NADP transhydrogenase beta subunit